MPTPAVSDPAAGPVVLDAPRRAEAMGRARLLAERLAAAGVTMVALSWVDNAGIARAKTIPLGRLERAAGWGIGMSPVFDVFLVNDTITTSPHIGGPGGDLRLVPHPDPAGGPRGAPGGRRGAGRRLPQGGPRLRGVPAVVRPPHGHRGPRSRPGTTDGLRDRVGARHRGGRGGRGRQSGLGPHSGRGGRGRRWVPARVLGPGLRHDPGGRAVRLRP